MLYFNCKTIPPFWITIKTKRLLTLTRTNHSELPWDQPSTGCAEYVRWKGNDHWTTQTPWSKIDTLALSLLRKILDPVSSKRIHLEKIIEHKWCHLQLATAGEWGVGFGCVGWTFIVCVFCTQFTTSTQWSTCRASPLRICADRYWVTLSCFSRVWGHWSALQHGSTRFWARLLARSTMTISCCCCCCCTRVNAPSSALWRFSCMIDYLFHKARLPKHGSCAHLTTTIRAASSGVSN